MISFKKKAKMGARAALLFSKFNKLGGGLLGSKTDKNNSKKVKFKSSKKRK